MLHDIERMRLAGWREHFHELGHRQDLPLAYKPVLVWLWQEEYGIQTILAGYLRYCAGDALSPLLIRPGAPVGDVWYWNDCLPDAVASSILPNLTDADTHYALSKEAERQVALAGTDWEEVDRYREAQRRRRLDAIQARYGRGA